ncbi:hypothetical protein ACKGJO_06695 [Gracilimonas sp. Q87]|uniref:hypothetical protein n=1 Tax=Gracilimonas sp. Q87 TaxID=3384766 RepID=UPI003984267A
MGAYGFLTMAGLAFTGITLNHQSTGANTKYVHLVGVVGAIVSAFLGFIVLEGIWITTVLMAMSIPMLYLYDKEHVVWNAEIVAMLMIVLSYVIM